MHEYKSIFEKKIESNVLETDFLHLFALITLLQYRTSATILAKKNLLTPIQAKNLNFPAISLISDFVNKV